MIVFNNMSNNKDVKDMQWTQQFNKFCNLVKSCIGAIDSLRLSKEILNHELFKDSELIQKIFSRYIKSYEETKQKWITAFKEFEDFVFIPPSEREQQENQEENNRMVI